MVFFDHKIRNNPHPKWYSSTWSKNTSRKQGRKNKAQKKRATTLHELWRIKKYV